MTKPYPKPRPRSGTTLVVLAGAGPGVPKKRGCVFWGAPQTRPRPAFTVCEVDPSLAVRTSIEQLMTAILSQRACGTRAGLKPAPSGPRCASRPAFAGRLSYASLRANRGRKAELRTG